jgi:ABC-type antimicrobial peptide transport system ATPase subunit
MSQAAAAKNPIVLDVREMRIQVRTDRGDGPVLVDNVSLTLKRGEVIGLIGESGAGKSTIGLASMGYTRRDCYIVGGQILFDGRDVRTMSADDRRKLRGPSCSNSSTCPIPSISASAIRIRSPAGNCNARWRRWRWSRGPTSSCSTSRPPRST